MLNRNVYDTPTHNKPTAPTKSIKLGLQIYVIFINTSIKEYSDGLTIIYIPKKAGSTSGTTLKINDLAAV